MEHCKEVEEHFIVSNESENIITEPKICSDFSGKENLILSLRALEPSLFGFFFPLSLNFLIYLFKIRHRE